MRGVIQRPIVYDCLMRPLEGRAYGRRRTQLFGCLTGAILEIGVGTGRNLDAYGPQAHVTACDIEPQLVAMARSRAPQQRMPVLVADAQRLPFRTAHFRYVTAALVFCSLPQPALALREIARAAAGRTLDSARTYHHGSSRGRCAARSARARVENCYRRLQPQSGYAGPAHIPGLAPGAPRAVCRRPRPPDRGAAASHASAVQHAYGTSQRWRAPRSGAGP